MKRKLIFILLALFMLGAILFAYVHTILLPTKVKEFIEVKSQDYLQRRITIGEINYEAFKGFQITQIRIYKENGHDLLFSADEARFNILVAPLFKQRALIIPSLYIKEPSYHLIRDAGGAFNALDIIQDSSIKNKKNGTTFIIGKIIIENGTLDYTDQTGEGEFFDSYHNIDAAAGLSLDRSISFSISAESEIKENNINVAGKYDLGAQTLSLQSRMNNFPFSDYLSLYWDHPGLSISGLRLTTESLNIQKKGASINIVGSWAASESTIRYQGHEVQGPFKFDDLKFQLRDGAIKLSGIFHADAKLSSADGAFRHSANMTLDMRSFGYADERYRALLNAELKNLSLATPDGTLQCDHAHIEGIDLSKFDVLTMIIKSAHCDHSTSQWADAASLESSIMLSDLRLRHAHGLSQISSIVSLDHAQLRTEDGLSLNTDLDSPSMRMEITKEAITTHGEFNFTDFLLALDKTRSFSGNPKVVMQLDYHPGAQAPINIKGELMLAEGLLKGFSALDPIENIRGNFSIETDKISSPSISFSASHTDFQASGRIDSLKNRNGAFSVTSQQFDLELLSVLFPVMMEKFSVTADGATAIELDYEGPLEKIAKDNLSLNVRLDNATVELKNSATKLENLSGAINFQANTLSWKDVELGYKNENFILTGSLKLAATPWLSTNIKNAHLDAHAKLTFDDEIIFIDEIKGHYARSTFDATGRIHHEGQADVSLKGNLHLDDTALLPEAIAARFALLNPKGNLDYRAQFIGDFNEWRRANITFNADSQAIRLINYPLQQFELAYRQDNGKINLFSLRSFVYKGQFNIDAQGDLSQKAIAFTSQTKLDHADLMEYRKDKNTANRLLSGTLDCAFTMRGLLLEPGSYIGLGKLQIREAYLGQLVPQMSAAIFTATEGDFKISGGKVQTDNARIISESLDLQAKGWVNFNKQIDFELIPTLKTNRLADGGKSKIDASTLLSKAVSIKMTGTLDNPVKHISTSTAGVIKNTTGVIAEGIGNILGELF